MFSIEILLKYDTIPAIGGLMMIKNKVRVVFVYFFILLQFLLHYGYLFYIIDIDKPGDPFDLFIFPFVFSLFIFSFSKYSLKKTLRYVIPFFSLWILFIIGSFFYYKYFNTILNLPLLFELLTDIEWGSIVHVVSFMGIWGLLVSLIFLTIPFLSIYLSFITKESDNKNNKKWVYVVIFLTLLQPIRNILDFKHPLSIRYSLAKTRIIVNAGLPFYLIYDYMKISDVNYGIPAKTYLPDRKDKKLPLKMGKDKVNHIIVLQIESLDGAIIGKKYDQKEITPFLNKLRKTSTYFSNMFANHLVGSADADFSALNSILPMKSTLTYNLNISHLPSLPHILKKSGIRSYFFQPIRGSFFNYEKAYREMGVYKYYHYKDFYGSARGWFSKDKEYYKQILKYIKSIKKNEKRFFCYIITMQSHSHFKNHTYSFLTSEDMKEISAKYKDKDAVLRTLNYFNVIHDVDKAISYFISQLEKENFFEDGVLIIFGDHTAEIESSIYNSYDGYPKNIEHIPLFILGKGIKKDVTINVPVEHLDLTPTLAELFKVPVSEYWYGVNIFRKNSYIILNNLNGFYIDNEIIYKSKNKLFLFKTKQKISENKLNVKHIEKYEKLIKDAEEYTKQWFYNDEK